MQTEPIEVLPVGDRRHGRSHRRAWSAPRRRGARSTRRGSSTATAGRGRPQGPAPTAARARASRESPSTTGQSPRTTARPPRRKMMRRSGEHPQRQLVPPRSLRGRTWSPRPLPAARRTEDAPRCGRSVPRRPARRDPLAYLDVADPVKRTVQPRERERARAHVRRHDARRRSGQKDARPGRPRSRDRAPIRPAIAASPPVRAPASPRRWA